MNGSTVQRRLHSWFVPMKMYRCKICRPFVFIDLLRPVPVQASVGECGCGEAVSTGEPGDGEAAAVDGERRCRRLCAARAHRHRWLRAQAEQRGGGSGAGGAGAWRASGGRASGSEQRLG
uniref:Uncharacterized protein n=1 Tax=Oryza barthii TaxID=65489 RepID=A0A0D3H9F8_9ORYZ